MVSTTVTLRFRNSNPFKRRLDIFLEFAQGIGSPETSKRKLRRRVRRVKGALPRFILYAFRFIIFAPLFCFCPIRSAFAVLRTFLPSFPLIHLALPCRITLSPFLLGLSESFPQILYHDITFFAVKVE